VLLIGSLNLDPRSSRINTELGVAVHSEELAKMVLDALNLDQLPGTFRLSLDADGESVRWRPTAGSDSTTEYAHDPYTTWWQRLRLLLMSRLVPEDLL
jgi:phosphatidylserine/phosphatidylglycerophosphate/cardiolipin synthase-like enzyme